MKRNAQYCIIRYCEVLQFMAAIYIRCMRRNLSQCIWANRQSLRLCVGREHYRYGHHCNGTTIWVNCLYALLILAGIRNPKKLIVKKRGSGTDKAAIYCAKIYPLLCSEPVAFVDELCAFNLRNKGLYLEDACIEVFGHANMTGDAEPCTLSRAHIALIITSFYDQQASYSDELREYFQTPRLVSVGDVVAVPWRRPWSRKVIDVFFKIVNFGELENLSEAFIDSRKTTLFQDEGIYDKIPYSDVTCYVPRTFSGIAQRISSLIQANSSMKTTSPPLVILLSGLPGSGKKLFLKHLTSVTHLDVYFSNCFDIWSDAPTTYETNIRNVFEKGPKGPFSILAFLNADLFGCGLSGSEQDTRGIACLAKCLKACMMPAIFLVCNNEKLSRLPVSLRSLILYHFEIPSLTEEDRKSVIMQELEKPNHIDNVLLSRQTNGFTLSELHMLAADAILRKHNTNSSRLKTEHFIWAIDKRNNMLADKIGAPIVPKVTWDDIGGLDSVKQIITESLILNLKGTTNMKCSGVLLYGPPGCGKTLIAKAIANQFKITFLSVKGPELLNKYVGQSEANVRRVFEKARLAAPCVVFFDELDSLASNRGRCGDSIRVSDNIVSQLTAELDCLEDSKVFVLGATNRPDLLDSSLLRPGRFDKIVKVDGMRDFITRERVLLAASRNVIFADDVNLQEIAQLCGHLSSGADLYAVISRAQMDAIRKRIQTIETGKTGEAEEQLLVTQNNLRNAVKEVIPSSNINYGQLRGL